MFHRRVPTVHVPTYLPCQLTNNLPKSRSKLLGQNRLVWTKRTSIFAYLTLRYRVPLPPNFDRWYEFATPCNSLLEYLKDIVPEMTKDFIKLLPDEPRVVVPHDDLSQLHKFETFHHTLFFQLQNQPMWQATKLLCISQSAARSLEESPRDNMSKHALGEFGFLPNKTSMTDICNSPSLASTHGYFVMTCGTRVTHGLILVFSSSKTSANQDILMPAPWYWVAVDNYKEPEDPDWSAKKETFFWRDSTTGGQSQALQLAAGESSILAQAETESGDVVWVPQNISRAVYKHYMDVGFTNIVQCDDDGCKEQEAAFGLKDKSLMYKTGVFHEWTNKWLLPWIHYIPLSLRFADGGGGDAGNTVGGKGSEWLEIICFFTSGPAGQKEATRLAMLKREWVAKTMRKDMGRHYRYGRVIHDERECIGYSYA
ncbi:glycosyltransferase family 90 protein [Xylaria curta]|nr:glycosyltransferase family 90 protein [Xylaria curta]